MLCKRTAFDLHAENKDPGHNSLSSQCREVAPALTSVLIYCWEGYPDRHFQNRGGRETWQHRNRQVFWSTGMGCWVPRWVSGEVPSLERKTPARAGGEGWTLGVALLSSASLGVFDKLTLCTLSVGLSLSNTRSATLQLPGSRCPRWRPAWAHKREQKHSSCC